MKRDMEIWLGENQRVDVHYKDFVIKTDQPERDGGNNDASSPFDLFLASLGACAGYYVKSFCRQRGLSEEGIRIVQRMHRDPEKKMITRIEIEIGLPGHFPERYEEAVIKAASACSVKKHIMQAPAFVLNTLRLNSSRGQ